MKKGRPHRFCGVAFCESVFLIEIEDGVDEEEEGEGDFSGEEEENTHVHIQ